MKKIIVIKLGSSMLMTARGKLDEFRIAHIADQIIFLKQKGFGVVLVVSGAVACGHRFIDFSDRQDLRQAAAGIGQAILTSTFTSIFAQKKMQTAQILLTRENVNSISRKQDLKNLLEFYLHSNIIAIVNENDVLDLNSFGGNDYLAAKLALLLKAERLLILSTYEKSLFGFGGGETKRQVLAKMKGKNINTQILNGKAQKSILQTIL